MPKGLQEMLICRTRIIPYSLFIAKEANKVTIFLESNPRVSYIVEKRYQLGSLWLKDYHIGRERERERERSNC